MESKYLITLLTVFFISCSNHNQRSNDSTGDYCEQLIGKISHRAKALSDSEFNGILSIEEYTDSLEYLFTDYKDSVFLRLNKDNPDYEFMCDTLWLGESFNVLNALEMNNTTLGMMQANNYNRILLKRLLKKYYTRLLSISSPETIPLVKGSHVNWEKSIGADYDLASEIARQQDGSMILYTWSNEVDKMLLQRAVYYYSLLRSLSETN